MGSSDEKRTGGENSDAGSGGLKGSVDSPRVKKRDEDLTTSGSAEASNTRDEPYNPQTLIKPFRFIPK